MMVASTTVPSRSSRTFSSKYCSTALKISLAKWMLFHNMAERQDGGGIRDVIFGKINPGEAADGAGVNQGVVHGVVGQGPPVLHQVNP